VEKHFPTPTLLVAAPFMGTGRDSIRAGFQKQVFKSLNLQNQLSLQKSLLSLQKSLQITLFRLSKHPMFQVFSKHRIFYLKLLKD
jgi:hypothetical protein